MSLLGEPECVRTVDTEVGAGFPIVEDTYYLNAAANDNGMFERLGPHPEGYCSVLISNEEVTVKRKRLPKRVGGEYRRYVPTSSSTIGKIAPYQYPHQGPPASPLISEPPPLMDK
jgi:hypothetical protein